MDSSQRARAVVRMTGLKQLVGVLKLKLIQEWIEDFLEGSSEKLVYMGVHKKNLHPLYEHFSDCAVLVDGGVTGKRRQKAVDRFQEDKNVRLFIGNVQAAGVGITLTAASTMLFGEFSWVPVDHTQAEDRIYRIGQEMPVHCYYSMVPGTIEGKLLAMIKSKQRVISRTLDQGLAEEGSGFDQLIRSFDQQ